MPLPVCTSAHTCLRLHVKGSQRKQTSTSVNRMVDDVKSPRAGQGAGLALMPLPCCAQSRGLKRYGICHGAWTASQTTKLLSADYSSQGQGGKQGCTRLSCNKSSVRPQEIKGNTIHLQPRAARQILQCFSGRRDTIICMLRLWILDGEVLGGAQTQDVDSERGRVNHPS